MRTIRSLIGRYDFGREIEAETMVNIRNPNQMPKGPLAPPVALAFTRGLAISLLPVAWRYHMSQWALAKG